MKLILEQDTKSYDCIEDNSSLLTVVTNRTPDTVNSIVTQVVKGEEFPRIKSRQLPYGGTGILHTYDNCVVHTNISSGFYYAYIRLNPLYFYYQNNKLVFYNSFSEIMAELWESDCELVESVRQEQRVKEDYLLAQQFARQKMVESLTLLTSLFLTIATIGYIVIREQTSSSLQNSFEFKKLE